MKQPIHLETREKRGKRLVSPSSERNCAPIGEKLATLLPENANVLEIASGTGQHGHHMCTIRPDIRWQPTDIDADSRDSQRAYAIDFPDRMLEPLSADVTNLNWWSAFDPVNAIYCANMIHIAPWAAAEGLARGAGKLLVKNASLYLYGPFLLEEGNAEGNLRFDENLKRRNPEWGVRTLESVKHMFAEHGLKLEETLGMPSNNFLLAFSA